MRLLLGGRAGGDAQAHLTLARQRGDGGVRGVEELLDLLRERRLPETGEVERLRDDGAVAAASEQRFERLLEHALHLRGHPRQGREERALPLDERPHRRPERVGDQLRPFGEERLLVVGWRGRAAELRELAVHVLARLLVLDHLPARQGRQALVGQVVRGRPEAAGRNHQVGPRDGLLEGADDPLGVVADGGVAVDADPELGEALAHPGRVGVYEVPEEHLGAYGQDLRAAYVLLPVSHPFILQSAGWKTGRKLMPPSKPRTPSSAIGSRRSATATP